MSHRLYIISLAIMLLAAALPQRAGANQYVDMYSDPTTEALMLATYGANVELDNSIAKAYSEIMGHYGLIMLSSSEIMFQKWMENRAMRDARELESPDCVYYRAMLAMIPPIVSEIYYTTALLAQKPEFILYWGPFMYLACYKTIATCAEYQTIVANNKVKFPYAMMPVMKQDLLKYVDLTKLGGQTDWKKMMDDFVSFDFQINKDSVINNSFDELKSLGAGIAMAGAEKALGSLGIGGNLDVLLNNDDLMKAFKTKPQELENAYNKVKSIMDGSFFNYANLKAEVSHIIFSGQDPWGHPKVNLTNIYSTAAGFNAESFMSNYIQTLQDQYYRQHFRIVVTKSGSKVLCNYTPAYGERGRYNGGNYFSWSDDASHDSNDDTWSSEWTIHQSPWAKKYESLPGSYTFTYDEQTTARHKAEGRTGWSPGRVARLNDGGGQYTYTISEEPVTAFRYFQSDQGRWCRRDYLAYSIVVTQAWGNDHVYWEKEMDTQYDDPDAVQAELQAQYTNALTEFGVDENSGKDADGNTVSVRIETEKPRYYMVPSDETIEGCNSAQFIVNCDNHTEMGASSLGWKSNPKLKGKGKDINKCLEELKRQAESTKIDGDDKADLNAAEAEIKRQEGEIKALEDRINVTKDAKTRTDLENRKTGLQHSLDSLNTAYNAMKADYAEEPDYDRIPHLERKLESRYNIVWTDDPVWDGATRIRHGKINGYSDVITFKGTLNILSAESWFHFIRYHRARITFDWELSSDQSSSNVVETIHLTGSDEQKEADVEKKQKEVMDMYPECNVSVNYLKADSIMDVNDSVNTHLMWESDRLSKARSLFKALNEIYSTMHKLRIELECNESLKDFLKMKVINRLQAVREEIAIGCLRSWATSSLKAAGVSATPEDTKEGGAP